MNVGHLLFVRTRRGSKKLLLTSSTLPLRVTLACKGASSPESGRVRAMGVEGGVREGPAVNSKRIVPNAKWQSNAGRRDKAWIIHGYLLPSPFVARVFIDGRLVQRPGVVVFFV